MFKENVLSGLSWLPLISRTVWAKNPRNHRDVAPLILRHFELQFMITPVHTRNSRCVHTLLALEPGFSGRFVVIVFFFFVVMFNVEMPRTMTIVHT